MSPSNPYVVSQLRNLIYYHLDNNHLQNAVFMAGRLHAYDPRSADAIHLLALCHLRLGQHKLAYEHSKNVAVRGGHLGCAYVFADACLVLSDGKEKEGITALERSRGLWGGRSNWSTFVQPHARLVHASIGALTLAAAWCRQALRNNSSTLPGCSLGILLNGQIMVFIRLRGQCRGLLCRGCEAESLHVGCFPWPLQFR